MSEARRDRVFVAALWIVAVGMISRDWVLAIYVGLPIAVAWGLFDNVEEEEKHE